MKKTKLRSSIDLKTRLGVTGALLGATLTGAALTGATQSREDPSRRLRATEFPFVTLTRSQSVHLNASHTVNPPDPEATASDIGPCRVLFRLFNSEGRVVAMATSTVLPGKTGQLVFANPPDPDMPIPGVRGDLALPPGPCKDAVVGSLEIIDTQSGEVKAVVAPASKASALQQNPPDPDSQGHN